MSWQDEKPLLRHESCWRCKSGHGGETICSSPGRIVKVRCEKTGRMGSINRACYCQKFEPLYKAELYYADDGIPVRNKTSLDYRTENQWWEAGRWLKAAAKGIDMHATMNSSKTFRYYLIDETVEEPYEPKMNCKRMASFNDISKCTKRDHASFQSCNCFDVDVATTGYCGGDSGHGGRTYFRLKDADCSDIDFRIQSDAYGQQSVEMMLGGDCELDTFIEALRWAADTLEKLASSK